MEGMEQEEVLREPQEPQVEPQKSQVESQEPQKEIVVPEALEGPEPDPMPVEEPHKNPIGIILAAILGLFGAATGFILGKKRKGK